MIREAMIKVLRYKAEHIKTKIKPKFFAEVADALEKEPKIEHWIPVSERLPEEFQRVLVTIVNYKGDKVVRVSEYYNRVFRIKENHERWEVDEKGLLAWTPLPKPYEPQAESEE